MGWCSLLKNALKYERFIIGQNIDTSKDAGDEHDDMEAEVRPSSPVPRPEWRLKGLRM